VPVRHHLRAMCRILALTLVALSLPMPAAALAQDPFSQLPPVQQQQTQTVQPTGNSSNDDEGLEGWQQTLIVLAGIFLLVGIGYAIVADARSKAPVAERAHGADADHRRPGSRLDPARRKEQARAKARRSRRQRKKNRSR
jgi:hypothetical protein